VGAGRTDRSRPVVGGTAKGRKLPAVLADAFGAADERLLEGLTDRERATFIGSVIKMSDEAVT
jgi:DNA-binding MarR family transcriptional regulator